MTATGESDRPSHLRAARADARSGAAFVIAGGVLALVAPVAGAILVSLIIAVVLLFGSRRDPVTIVGAMFVLFVAVPTRYSFVGFGPLTPGMLVGSLGLLWWLWSHVTGSPKVDRGPQPMRVLVLVLLIGAAIGFATMFTHPVTSEQFVNAHRSPGILLMFVGITLLIADGVSTRRRLVDLLEILVLCGGALALCGLIEQVTGQRLFAGKILPLLTENPSQLTITPRNGFLRVAGTAKHPIEFAVVLATILPLAIHLSLYGRPGFRRTARWLAVTMGVALPLAISRSGVVGAAVGLLVMSLGWSWKRRANVVVLVLSAVAVFTLVTPRLADTMSTLFTGVREDTSTTARTRDYHVLDDVLRSSPVFGRGLGAYNVVDYEVFDNQYLASIVDGGYLGLGIQVLSFLAPALLAWGVGRRARDEATRHLAQAVTASICVLGVTWAFFDGGGYRIASALVYTLLGITGALWRLEIRDRRLAPGAAVPADAWGSEPHEAGADGVRVPVGAWGRSADPLGPVVPYPDPVLPLPIPAPSTPVPQRELEPVPISVIVPAHDEELVIARFLSTLLEGARPGEVEVIVVCNGCEDRTAELARRFPVRVVETTEASKHLALNRGDALATRFPRFYVDADVQVSAHALRVTAGVLASGRALAAAPSLRLDLDGCHPMVRAYYRVWRRLPYVTTDLVGSGVYGVSKEGHDRLGRFPSIIADDLWFRNQFRPGERRSVRDGIFVQQPPRDLRSLMRVRTRQCLGSYEYQRRFGPSGTTPRFGRTERSANTRTRYLRGLLHPRSIAGAPVYVAVNAMARQSARRRWRAGALQWDADRSARLGSAT